jgi:TolB protein
MMKTAALMLVSLSGTVFGQPHGTNPTQPPLDWKSLEAPFLTNHRQLTARDQFMKAGEAYFSPDGEWIIFQATAVPRAGAEADPFYAMFVAELSGNGLAKVTRISPAGSANTCGWFHPTALNKVIFGSTLTRPSDEQKSGFQVGSRKYVWMFPAEMEIVEAPAFAIAGGINGSVPRRAVPKEGEPTPLFTLPNYDAECSFSADGRFVLYAHIEQESVNGRPDANIYIFDTTTKKHHAIVVAPGYDGGPFFSPDGESICYRSDRKGDDLLQLFAADLRFENGVPVGIEKEYQLTDNEHVNWAPYWHPSGEYIVYGTSEVGHFNYEVFAVESDLKALRSGAKTANQLKRARITQADGADVLPVFSPDGRRMMWTSQRGPKAEGEGRSSSQLWIADVTGSPFARD